MATLSSGAAQLRKEIDRLWPHRDKASDGWNADARHLAAGTSDHIPDDRGIVHAIDVDKDLDPSDKKASWNLADQIRRIAITDGRIKYIIHMGQIASAKRNIKGRSWQWRKHDGDPHMHHIHISFTTASDTNARPYGIRK